MGAHVYSVVCVNQSGNVARAAAAAASASASAALFGLVPIKMRFRHCASSLIMIALMQATCLVLVI